MKPGSDAVRADITIEAAPEEVWETVMDPGRMSEWVTIHRKMDSADSGPPKVGMQMKQTLCLRGAKFKVQWELAECEEAKRAVWQGRGPMRSQAHTEYELAPDGDGGTRFHYVNEFKAPGGPLGKAASRALVGGLPKREAERSLKRLKALLEK